MDRIVNGIKKISLSIAGGFVSDFDTLRDVTKIIAKQRNPNTSLLSWYDKKKDKCSPTNTYSGSCTVKKGEPEWEKYARNHGGSLKIEVNNGDYIFIYS